MVIFTFDNRFERCDRVFELDEHTADAGEDFRNVEWLRQELLDLTRTGHGQLIFFGQLVHAENGDDILQRLVLLQGFLDFTRCFIMLFTDNARLKNTRCRNRADQLPGKYPAPKWHGSAWSSRPSERMKSLAQGR